MQFPEKFRVTNAASGYFASRYASRPGEPFGAFMIPGPQANGRTLAVIAVDGEGTGWEHVSVSLPDSPKKCPSWAEMCLVKALFWGDEECVVQFHPAKSEYVNHHPGCLHLWRCVGTPFPIPPKIFVGPSDPIRV